MSKLKVKDVMNKGVVFVNEDASALDVAKIMIYNNIGSVLVYGNNKGIISKTDLIEKIILKNKDPKKTKAKEIMTYPIITINCNEDLKKAAELIKNKKVGRLIVTDEKGRYIGVISKSDLAYLEPSLIDIFEEMDTLINNQEVKNKELYSVAGYCDECGEYSDELYPFGDMYLCEKCLEEKL